MTVGFLLTALSFLCAAILQYFVDLYPNRVHVAFQIPQYLIMCFAEILVSISGLEFAFTQAPESMKSIMTSFFLLTVAVGNILVAVIADLPFPDVRFKQVYEFLFFTVLVTIFMFIFLFIIRNYKYIEDKPKEKVEEIEINDNQELIQKGTALEMIEESDQ